VNGKKPRVRQDRIIPTRNSPDENVVAGCKTEDFEPGPEVADIGCYDEIQPCSDNASS
jgi:hypothetical protein